LWGAPPAGSRPGRRAARPGFLPILAELVDVVLDPSASAQVRFGDVLRDLAEYGRRERLIEGFSSEEAVRLLIDAWHERGPRRHRDGPAVAGVPPDALTLYDAVSALQLFEHALRAVVHPPVRADILHASTNGLGVLPALAAKWQHGTP